jgi:hypothetical protein
MYDSTKPSMADLDFPTSFANIRENQRSALAGEVPPNGGNGQTAAIAGVNLPLSTAAAVGVTNLLGGGVAGAVYRVSYYLTVGQAATTSSAVQVNFSHNDGRAFLAKSSANLNSNVVMSDSGSFVFGEWSSSPITYAVTYASVGATPMQYGLMIVVEKIR